MRPVTCRQTHSTTSADLAEEFEDTIRAKDASGDDKEADESKNDQNNSILMRS
jgi:hypothetical protein